MSRDSSDARNVIDDLLRQTELRRDLEEIVKVATTALTANTLDAMESALDEIDEILVDDEDEDGDEP